MSLATYCNIPEGEQPYVEAITFHAFTYDIYEINGEDIGFLRGVTQFYETAAFDMGLLDDEKTLVTTTPRNPVIYISKVKMDDLAAFFRQDWLAKEKTDFYEKSSEERLDEIGWYDDIC